MQKIIQVAGRAGRATDNSTVIIQAMIDHPIFQHTQEVSYLAFYNAEIEKRMAVGYPPDIRLAEIELKGNNEHDIDYDATQLAEFLHTHKAGDTIILGPAKPMVYKIKNTHIRKIYLKDTRLHNLISLFQKINLKSYTSHIYFTPNPLG